MLSRTQAVSGRTAKQEQERISPNHVPTIFHFSYIVVFSLANFKVVGFGDSVNGTPPLSVAHAITHTDGRRDTTWACYASERTTRSSSREQTGHHRPRPRDLRSVTRVVSWLVVSWLSESCRLTCSSRSRSAWPRVEQGTRHTRCFTTRYIQS